MAVVLQRLGGARDRASAFRGAVGPIPPVTESGPRRTPPQGGRPCPVRKTVIPMALGVSAAVGAVDDRGTGGGSRRTVPEFERRLDKRLVISIVAVGVMSFAGVVVETAMNIAFPALMREFGVTTAAVQWVTTGYLLVLSAIMPISSFLIRRFRIRTLFVVAMVAFLVGTLVCAAAPQFVLLIVGRVLQGLGTGIALPLMFTIVLQQVPLAQLGTMMGVATLITAMAPRRSLARRIPHRRLRLALDLPGTAALPRARPRPRRPDHPSVS